MILFFTVTVCGALSISNIRGASVTECKRMDNAVPEKSSADQREKALHSGYCIVCAGSAEGTGPPQPPWGFTSSCFTRCVLQPLFYLHTKPHLCCVWYSTHLNFMLFYSLFCLWLLVAAFLKTKIARTRPGFWKQISHLHHENYLKKWFQKLSPF